MDNPWEPDLKPHPVLQRKYALEKALELARLWEEVGTPAPSPDNLIEAANKIVKFVWGNDGSQ